MPLLSHVTVIEQSFEHGTNQLSAKNSITKERSGMSNMVGALVFKVERPAGQEAGRITVRQGVLSAYVSLRCR